MRGTQEFEDLQAAFEKVSRDYRAGLPYFPSAFTRSKRKPDGTWPSYFYEEGPTDAFFRLYMHGYSFGKCVFQSAGDRSGVK